jgi:hypothetical protein
VRLETVRIGSSPSAGGVSAFLTASSMESLVKSYTILADYCTRNYKERL